MVATFTHVVLAEPLTEAGAAFWERALDATWRAAGPGPDRPASLVPADGDAYVHRARPGEVAPALVLEVDDLGTTVRRVEERGATPGTSGPDR